MYNGADLTEIDGQKLPSKTYDYKYETTYTLYNWKKSWQIIEV